MDLKSKTEIVIKTVWIQIRKLLIMLKLTLVNILLKDGFKIKELNMVKKELWNSVGVLIKRNN